jgi:hypothetical protein
METWPVELQDKFNVDSFGVQFGDTAIRSEVDAGFDKVRSRYTRGIDVYTSTIDLDIEDYDALILFYKTTLGNGVRTFGFQNPLSGNLDEFRFRSPPAVRPLGSGGRYFRVSMTWELVP